MNIELPSINPMSVQLDSAKTLLVIVDMENDFCSPGGVKYVGSQAVDTIRNVKKLIERARSLSFPIVYVQSLRNKNSPEIAVYGRAPYIMEGTWGAEIAESIKPKDGDHIVRKDTHDCFHQTTMDDLLKRLGADSLTHQIIVCGVTTTTCVYHAVLGFHVRHYRVYVPIDCTTARNEQNKMMALSHLNSTAYNFNVTITSSDLIGFRPRS